jgi:hypothetical protein
MVSQQILRFEKLPSLSIDGVSYRIREQNTTISFSGIAILGFIMAMQPNLADNILKLNRLTIIFRIFVKISLTGEVIFC